MLPVVIHWAPLFLNFIIALRSCYVRVHKVGNVFKLSSKEIISANARLILNARLQ